MFVVPTNHHQHSFVDTPAAFHRSPSSSPPQSTSHTYGSQAKPQHHQLSALLSLATSSMDRSSAPEYPQTGLPSPYPSNFGDTQSEGSPAADHAPASSYPVKQEINFSTQQTPASEYNVYPPSARSGSFPEHISRPYHPAATAGSGDPSIAAPSPTYPYPPSPYAAGPHVPHYAAQDTGMYAGRAEWSYGPNTPMTPHGVFPPSPASAAPRSGTQVYSFVPIPGAQQHKRPRRRYEEIERMYKCGWNGCEKAYGTLNHLNAHVTMQSHGSKRTPEEFKEIRRGWKERKKQQEIDAREKEEQRQAEATAGQGGPDSQPGQDDASQASTPYQGNCPILPPIGTYQASPYGHGPPPSSVSQQPLEYTTSPMYSNYPQSASYGPSYGQSTGPPPPNQ